MSLFRRLTIIPTRYFVEITNSNNKEYNPDFVGYERISDAKDQIILLKNQLKNTIDELLPSDCHVSKSFGEDYNVKINDNDKINDKIHNNNSNANFPTITGLDEEKIESLKAQIELVKELAINKVWESDA